MSKLELKARDVHVGYGKDGFYAFGSTTDHSLERSDFNEEGPPIEGQPIDWFIKLTGANQYEEYKCWRSSEGERDKELEEHYGLKYPARCQLRRWRSDKRTVLEVSYPNDPALAAFLTGVAMHDQGLSIYSPGWCFLAEDRVAPAVSCIGFMEREEPAFSADYPILRSLTR